MAANGILPLIVPVYRSRAQLPVREVKIDNHTDWQRMHWQSIQSAYGKAPFYEYYIDGLAKFYSKKDQFTYLFDLNCSLFEYLLPKAGIELEKMQFLSEKTGTEHYEDLCSNIHPKEKYDKSDPAFVPRKYIQVFSDRYEFIPNLSIIDLLFNEGPNTAAILQQSTD